MIQSDNEVKEDKKFIEDLISTQPGKCFIVFDKKDITLKIHIDEFKMKIQEQEFYSKVDARIDYIVDSEDIIWMLENIPNHLSIRLEADYFDETIKLMKSKILIEKLREQVIKFLYKGIEIEPRIIESKMDEDDLKNEVKELKAKRCRLNTYCD